MGKYIHLFQSKEEFNQAVGSNFTAPWVSYTKENDKVDYYKSEYEHKCEQYFTIEATEDETIVYFRQSSHAANDGLDPLKVEVSTDNGETWTEVTAVQDGDVLGATLAELNKGDKALIRGRNEAYGYYSNNEDDAVENCNFLADSPCYVYGNIMSLIDGDDFARIRKVKEYAFAYLFSDYDGELDSSWVLSKQGEKLLLPATMLAESCYCGMFQHCTSLTSAPELPATTLANSCYGGMFRNCTSLTVAPELPATTMVYGCYGGMFGGCTGLTSAPELPATTLANGCYSGMFDGCTSLVTAPELPAVTLAYECYFGMFKGCTGLTTAPELPAVTLADYCYGSMFYGCTNLSYIKAMFTTTPGLDYTGNWVNGVKATGTFIKNSAATWNVTGVNGIPTGWTVETADA